MHTSELYKPEFFRLVHESDKKRFNQLLSSDSSISILDEIESQLRELIKSHNPSTKIKLDEYPDLIAKHLGKTDIKDYGVWVYYPWSRIMLHLLDEQEFVEVRTNRNKYKITQDEQDQLKAKKIGVVGLSVGQSIALTLAMERTCGELRLADFDTAELSNLNRIRTGLHNLGLRKTVIAAREIAEIDPFINVRIFNEGLTNDNLDSFFLDGGKLDLLVEVCDGLNIKIISRFKARELNVPVVMDTNDRGLLDVERFDLEPNRPILHGLAEGLDPKNITDLTNEEKIPYILRMVGAENISMRLKASMIEVEQSINTWPQLASSVVLGGAVTTDVCRRILLDQYHDSGRYYLDIEEIVRDGRKGQKFEVLSEYLPPVALTKEELLHIVEAIPSGNSSGLLSDEDIHKIVEAAILAPSGGNSQPWKFVYKDGRLFVFHDMNASYSFLDFNNLGAYIALGAAIENIIIQSQALGYDAGVDHSSFKEGTPLVAIVNFKKLFDKGVTTDLIDAVRIRLTNRNIGPREPLSDSFYKDLKQAISGPVYFEASLDIIEEWDSMRELGDVLATCEKLVLMHPRGHFDAFKKELRWTEEENKEKCDGLDVATLGISKGEISALRIANDPNAIGFVRDTIKGGNAFKKMAQKAVNASSALGIVSMPEYSAKNFLLGGRAVERVWLEANAKRVSFQPITQFTFLLARLMQGDGIELDENYKREFAHLKNRFFSLLPHLENRQPIFIFRLCKADEPQIKALRKPVDSVLIS